MSRLNELSALDRMLMRFQPRLAAYAASCGAGALPDDGEVDAVLDVRRDALEPVDEDRAHRARLRRGRAVHHVVDDEAAPVGGEVRERRRARAPPDGVATAKA